MVSVVVESSSVLVEDPSPPMRSIPAGLCQDTWRYRPSDREWDCSHSPSKVMQLVRVSTPPQAVNTDVPYLPDSPDRSDLARGASG